MIRKYRKKPVVIEAIVWNGENLEEVVSFTGIHPKWDTWFKTMDEYKEYIKNDNDIFKIITLEGNMKASKGDYIIKGVHGEFYPCKPDIFEQTYEGV